MRYLLLLVLGGLSVTSSHAQITITEADLRALVGRAYTATDYDTPTPEQLAPLTQLRGGPHTFNFGTVAYEPLGTTTYTPTACAPTLPGCDDPRLSGAGLILRLGGEEEGTTMAFSDLDATGYRNRGGASRSDLDPTVPGDEDFKYVATPSSLVLALPLQMGRTWNGAYRGEISYNGAVVAEEDVSEQAQVVAFGTLVTPAGSADALVVRQQTVSTTTIGGDTSVDTTVTYTFITRGALQANLTTDGQGQVFSAGYSVTTTGTAAEPVAGGPDGLALDAPAPNPARQDARLGFTLDAPRTVRVSVHDLLGREVAVLAEGAYATGRHTLTLDAARLAPGAYVVRLAADGFTRTRVLSVAR